MNSSVLSSAACLLTLCAGAASQDSVHHLAQNNYPDDPRSCARILFVNESMRPFGQLAIQYGRPAWRDEHLAWLDKHRAEKSAIRLGANFWTLLYTDVPLTFGDTRIEPGMYAMALRARVDDHSFSLLLRSSTEIMAMRQDGWRTAALSWPIEIPMQHDRRESGPGDRLTITLHPSEQDQTVARLRISWGPSQLTTAVRAHLPAELAEEDRKAR